MIFLKLGSWLASQKADRNVQLHSRSPHGERGLKLNSLAPFCCALGRSPHGERGLKYGRPEVAGFAEQSLSSRRAWIEIANAAANSEQQGRSPHGERGLKFDCKWCRRNI